MKLDPDLGDIRVEIAFPTKPDDPNPAFIDISDDVNAPAGINITHGRGDEYSKAQTGMCKLTLDNTRGNYTVGYTLSPYYPNVKIRKKLRTTFRPRGVTGNFYSAEDATFEGGTTGTWTGSFQSIANSATHPHSGTKGLLITWATAANQFANPVRFTGLVVGRTYTAYSWVWVPTASPDVLLSVLDGGGAITLATGTPTATKNAPAQIVVTFVAISPTAFVQLKPNTAPSAGQQCWLDDNLLEEGSTPAPFSTNPPPIYYRHTGYIDEFPTEWPDGGDYSEAAITSVDRFKRLGNNDPLRSAVAEEILLDQPSAYYTLGEPSTSTMAGDISGNGANTLTPIALGALLGGSINFGQGTGPPMDSAPAVVFTPVSSASGQYLFADVTPGVVVLGNMANTMECFLATASNVASDVLVGEVTQGDLFLELSITATGHLQAAAAAGSVIITSTFVLANSATHHVAITQVKSGSTVTVSLYINGALDVTGTYTVGLVGGIPGINKLSVGGSSHSVCNATISHVAVYAKDLGATRIAVHAQAGFTAFSGERSDQRVARYARYVGIPTAEQALDVGLSTSVSPAIISSQSPLAAMQDMETTEGGVLFMAGDGRLTFHSRSRRYNAVSVLTLGENDIAADAKFAANDAYLINDVTANRPGGITFRAINQPSIDDNGTAAISPTLMINTDVELIDAANWKANQTAQVVARLPNLTLDLLTNSALLLAVLALEVGSVITLQALPGTAPASSIDMFIEGWAETISDTGWKWMANCSPVGLTGVWQLDSATHSQLDSTTRLAY
jgi:hypothetical protein